MRRLKGIVLGWLYRVSLALPPKIGMYVLNRTLPRGRPVLDYLELHLADHCNLNCAGCLHYAPFADKRFADIEVFKCDFKRLKELFSNIRHIRLKGGEPLLNPKAAEFVRIARDSFPKSAIRVVTNGLKLVPPLDDPVLKLLAVMQETHVGVDWTKYPPVASREDAIKKVCSEAGVDLRITENSTFMARLLRKGGAGILRSFKWCRKRMYCPILYNGRIYTCAPARYAGYYNRRAGTHIPEEPGIDIYKATANEILFYLMSPSFSCSHCAAGMRQFPWKSNAKLEDWIL